MRLPRAVAPLVFQLILTGLMSWLVSGIATWRAVGLGPGFVASWSAAWVRSSSSW